VQLIKVVFVNSLIISQLICLAFNFTITHKTENPRDTNEANWHQHVPVAQVSKKD